MGNRLVAAGILVPCAALVGGCAQLYEPKPRITPLSENAALTSPASITHTLVVNRKTGFVTCAMPPPDATFTQSEQGNITIALISTGGGSDGSGEAEQSGEGEMAGRTPAVLMARELFFRLCEFSRNYELTKDEALQLYGRTLDTVKGGWNTEAGNTKVTIGDKVTSSQSEALGALPMLPSSVKTGSATTSQGTDSGTTDSSSSSSSSSTGDSDGF